MPQLSIAIHKQAQELVFRLGESSRDWTIANGCILLVWSHFRSFNRGALTRRKIQLLSLFVYILLFVALFGCQSSSYDDFREKGRAQTRSLISVLKSIRTKDQLIAHENELRTAFQALAILAERVQEYRKQYPQERPQSLTQEDRELSDALRIEILRIHRLDGGNEILDKCRHKT